MDSYEFQASTDSNFSQLKTAYEKWICDMQNFFMITITFNFLISHENIQKFCLEIITWHQKQKIPKYSHIKT